MSKPVEIPEQVERELTLVHSETCDCNFVGHDGRCDGIRNILRREIAKAILLARVEEREEVAKIELSCGGTPKQRKEAFDFHMKEAAIYRKQAAALGEEGE